MSKELEEIENPWCVYGAKHPMGYLSLDGYGKIISESKDGKTLEIIYSKIKGHTKHPELWYSKNVKRFSTLEEAAKTYQEHHNNHLNVKSRPITDERINEEMRWKFPLYFGEKNEHR